MRVVLDTNVLLSALLSPHGLPDTIYRAWQKDHFDLMPVGVSDWSADMMLVRRDDINIYLDIISISCNTLCCFQ